MCAENDFRWTGGRRSQEASEELNGSVLNYLERSVCYKNNRFKQEQKKIEMLLLPKSRR